MLTAQHPLRERLRAQHMLALYRSGRQADALAAYRDARRTLVAELGLEPARRCGGSSGPCSSRTRNSAYPTPCRPRLGHAPPCRALQHLWALAGAGALVLIAALAALLLMDGGRSSPSAPSPPVIHSRHRSRHQPRRGRVPRWGHAHQRFSRGRAAWTLSADEQTVSRVDPQTETVKTFATGAPDRPGCRGRCSGSCKARSPSTTRELRHGEYSGGRGAHRSTLRHAAGHQPASRAGHCHVAGPAGDLVAADGGVVERRRPGWVHRLDTARGRVLTQRSARRVRHRSRRRAGLDPRPPKPCRAPRSRYGTRGGSRRAAGGHAQRDCCRRGLGVADRPRGRDGVRASTRGSKRARSP